MKVFTYGYGLLDLLTEGEPFKYSRGYNDS